MSTNRLGIPKLISTDPPRPDLDINTALDDIDNKMAYDMQGTIASRPAAGIRGRYYTATDQSNKLYRDTGSTWVVVHDDNINTIYSNYPTSITVTTLPTSPANGRSIFYRPIVGTPEIIWHLAWDTALNGGSGAWAYIGGPYTKALGGIITSSNEPFGWNPTNYNSWEMTKDISSGSTLTIPETGDYILSIDVEVDTQSSEFSTIGVNFGFSINNATPIDDNKVGTDYTLRDGEILRMTRSRKLTFAKNTTIEPSIYVTRPSGSLNSLLDFSGSFYVMPIEIRV